MTRPTPAPKPSLRLTLLVNTFPGLSETFIFRKALGLAQRGHHVHIIAGNQGNWAAFASYQPLPATLRYSYPFGKRPTRPRLLVAAVGQFWRGALRHPLALLRLTRLAWQAQGSSHQRLSLWFRHLPFLGLRTDVVHCEFLGIAAAYPLLGALLRRPVVLSCRGADLHLLDQYTGEKRANYLAQLQNASAVHCVSAEIAQEVTRLSQRQTGLWINRPAIEFERIQPKTDFTPKAKPLIVSVGRLVWKKGFDYLFNALWRLKERGIPFEAQVIGDGVLRAALQSTLADLGLTEDVTLVGPLPSHVVLQRLQTADIFALFSHEEGISNAVLEAMASGLPIMTSDAGGMAEAVTDGVEGYVVRVRDIETYTERLATLLQAAPLRQQMGAAARQRASTEFSIERQLHIFETLYHHLTQQEATP